MTTRRSFMIGTGALVGCGVLGGVAPVRAENGLGASWDAEISRIEHDSGGRLGVAMLDTLNGARAGHHVDDRFPMCSTFKLLASAAVLKRVEAGQDRLERRITFEARDIVINSAITKDRTGGDGMALEELCAAAMAYSDNTAGNLLLASLGGPPGLTAYARSLGDTITRLDRIEPDLNESVPGDLRDTTTPTAMLGNVQTLVLGEALSEQSRARLTAWLVGNKTGDTRLRAGLPATWRVGDKTGSGDRGSTNDIGIIWPPRRAPILVAIYLTETDASADGAMRHWRRSAASQQRR